MTWVGINYIFHRVVEMDDVYLNSSYVVDVVYVTSDELTKLNKLRSKLADMGIKSYFSEHLGLVLQLGYYERKFLESLYYDVGKVPKEPAMKYRLSLIDKLPKNPFWDKFIEIWLEVELID